MPYPRGYPPKARTSATSFSLRSTKSNSQQLQNIQNISIYLDSAHSQFTPQAIEEYPTDTNNEYADLMSKLRECSKKIKKKLDSADEVNLQTSDQSHLDVGRTPLGRFTTRTEDESPRQETISPSSPVHREKTTTNYGRFIHDQCFRVQTALAGEYHMRRLQESAETLTSELNTVDSVMTERRKQSIQMRDFRETRNALQKENNTEGGELRARDSENSWLEDLKALLEQVSEFVGTAFDNRVDVRHLQGKRLQYTYDIEKLFLKNNGCNREMQSIQIPLLEKDARCDSIRAPKAFERSRWLESNRSKTIRGDRSIGDGHRCEGGRDSSEK